MLDRTDRLDASLMNWRDELPRWLRFDRGHTFEQISTLKRQRNMLAIKFHHLRCLIHRPYLCLPCLQKDDANLQSLLSTHASRVVRSETICVKEAQETAHMLHNVRDKKSLVEDFPWWQMISCLICASSILLVRRACISQSTSEERTQRELLEEDADTCLKVFDALSTNSDAARLARDMLRNLRAVQYTGSLRDGTLKIVPGNSAVVNDSDATAPVTTKLATSELTNEGASGNIAPQVAGLAIPASSDFQLDNEWNRDISGWDWQDFPSEIADSMSWSSQFMDTLDPRMLFVPTYP